MDRLSESTLKQWLSKYQNPDVVLRDIKNAICSMYKGLTPQQDDYTFNDGTTKKLVNLNGTIPVTYKGSTYHIPICIWLMDTHSKHAPICYVKPTCDMAIKPSKYVDQNGKIYLPYLHDWNSTSSDLLSLIHIMIAAFGEMPPVFSKARNSAPYPSPSTPLASGYGPPYPTPYPTNANFGGSSMPPYPVNNTVPNVMPYGVYPPSYPQFNNGNIGMPSAGISNSGTIKDEHIRNSLISAIEDKLKRRAKEQFQQTQAELDTLRRTQEELKDGKNKLENILTMLEKERNDLDRNITLLKDKETELNKAIEKLDVDEPFDVDDAVTTTAPLYNQLLNTFAEESALEDAIYYMGEALRNRLIDPDLFLRHVRILSRKQFMLRALMQKSRQKAGLPM